MAEGRRETGSISKTSVETTGWLADLVDLSRLTLRLMNAPARDTPATSGTEGCRGCLEIILPRDGSGLL